MKFFTIPIFVPELACPNRCVFCNQHTISGCHSQPDSSEVTSVIESRLATIYDNAQRYDELHVEIGFFGGNFTGIDEYLQRDYLSIAYAYLEAGRVHGIRLSTRPDYITIDSIRLLQEYGVTTIELGAQSLDEAVLTLSGRGHTANDIERASNLILKNGFELGLQMMTGLPGDTPDKAIETAHKIVALGAGCTRIYPTMVIRGTELEKLWRAGNYHPQSLEDAIDLTARLMEVFEQSNVNVIRVGLHPSEDLIQGGELLAGPFHVSFRQLAETRRWKNRLTSYTPCSDGTLTVVVPVGQMGSAIGYNGSNRDFLEQKFSKVLFIETKEESMDKPLIIADKKIPLPAKNALAQLGSLIVLEPFSDVYKSIAGHPDIFLCAGNKNVVTAPCVSEKVIQALQMRGHHVISGISNPGKTYPASAAYNAVIAGNLLIHNLKITDLAIKEVFNNLEYVHVNQGYTRCNLLMLGPDYGITSDRGIEKILSSRGMEVLFVDPSPIVLKGQKHGFFPGCCGLIGNTVIINGNLKYHPDEKVIRDFIHQHQHKILELFDGKLSDAGSILIF